MLFAIVPENQNMKCTDASLNAITGMVW